MKIQRNTMTLFLIIIIIVSYGCANRCAQKVSPRATVNDVCGCIDEIDDSHRVDVMKSAMDECLHKLDTNQLKTEGKKVFDSLYHNCGSFHKLLASIYVIENNIDTTVNIVDSKECLNFRNRAFIYYGSSEDTLFIYDNNIIDKTKFGTKKHRINWIDYCTFEYKYSETDYLRASFINKIADTVTLEVSEYVMNRSYMKFILVKQNLNN